MRISSLGIIASFLFFTVACERDLQRPGYQIKILSDMVEPVPYEAFTKNPVFADGKTLQSPPVGSVPRGFEPFSYEATDAGAEKAGVDLSNPEPLTQVNLQRGKFIYEAFCLSCHGDGGDGDGPLIPKYPNPPSFHSTRLKAMPDGRMFHVITLGRRDMPAHGSQIEVADRWRLIRYVRELQKAADSK